MGSQQAPASPLLAADCTMRSCTARQIKTRRGGWRLAKRLAGCVGTRPRCFLMIDVDICLARDIFMRVSGQFDASSCHSQPHHCMLHVVVCTYQVEALTSMAIQSSQSSSTRKPTLVYVAADVKLRMMRRNTIWAVIRPPRRGRRRPSHLGYPSSRLAQVASWDDMPFGPFQHRYVQYGNFNIRESSYSPQRTDLPSTDISYIYIYIHSIRPYSLGNTTLARQLGCPELSGLHHP